MQDRDLNWRAEETCTNAWPSLRQAFLADWLLRFAPGVSRRANSANPLRPEAAGLEAALPEFHRIFTGQGLPLLVRLPSFLDPAAEALLARQGFTAEGETLTLFGRPAAPAASDPQVTLAARPDEAWLAVRARFAGVTAAQAETYGRMVGAIALPTAFAGLKEEGELRALAYGALHRGLLCIKSVATAEAFRGRGYARRTLGALFAWARGQGAEACCLQVQADNDPAIRLYRGLGLERELYRYHYRRAP